MKSFTPRTRQVVGAAAGLMLIAASVGAVNVQPIAQASPAAAAPTGLTTASIGQLTVNHSIKNDVSIPLRDVPALNAPAIQISENPVSTSRLKRANRVQDNVVQPFTDGNAPSAVSAPIANFDGVNTRAGLSPPDTVGEVGKTQYVQMTNAGFQVFDKLGTSVYGPAPVQSLWYNFGGACEFNNDGDPIVLYDQLADRWLLSQFAVPGGGQGFHECIAVSQTGDAAGAYNRYDFFLSSSMFFDYPQLGVWPDGYYGSFNVFNAAGSAFIGGGVTAYDRAQMLAGQPATVQIYLDPQIYGYQPTDLEGTTLPPAGLGNIFLEPEDGTTGSLRARLFTPNWSNPAASTTSVFTLTVAPWNEMCPSTSRQACIPQPAPGNPLEVVGAKIMHRMAYRNFGAYGSWTATHSVDAGTNQAGMRWYEFRNIAALNPTLFQQGTYAGQAANTDNRWMGSIAQDRFGNIALGFSISSASVFPGIRYTGRVLTDTLGTMPQGEQVLMNGAGVANASNRWGDYSSLTVDPTDDCTFYYTNEYFDLPVTNIRWSTRIGSFRLPGCAGAPVATQTATGTPATSTATVTRQATTTVTATPTGTRTPQVTATATAITGCDTTVITGSFTDSDPRAAARYFPSFTSSQCDFPTTFAGTQAGQPHYDTYTFYNATGGPQCVTVHVDTPCTYYTNQRIYSAAYLNSFNPADISQNWIGDIGGPAPNNNAYSFSVPAGATYVVVMAEYVNDTLCPDYTLTVSCGISGGTPTVTTTSTATSTAATTATSTTTSTAVTTVTGTVTATTTPCAAFNFSDVSPSDYFYQPVQYLACHGVIGGYADGSFRPYNNTTRGQMAKIVTLGFNLAITTPTGGQTFEDVPPGSTFYPYIETIAARQIASGYACGSVNPQTTTTEPCIAPNNRPYFRPGNDITRGQLVKLVVIAASQQYGWDILNPTTPSFTDVPSGSTFYEYIETAVCHQVLGGYNDGTFRSNNPAFRGQISKIVYNAVTNNVSGCVNPTVTATATP